MLAEPVRPDRRLRGAALMPRRRLGQERAGSRRSAGADGLATARIRARRYSSGERWRSRATSSWPSIAVSGVRSWCDASPVKRRWRSNDSSSRFNRSLNARAKSSSSSPVAGAGKRARQSSAFISRAASAICVTGGERPAAEPAPADCRDAPQPERQAGQGQRQIPQCRSNRSQRATDRYLQRPIHLCVRL